MRANACSAARSSASFASIRSQLIRRVRRLGLDGIARRRRAPRAPFRARRARLPARSAPARARSSAALALGKRGFAFGEVACSSFARGARRSALSARRSVGKGSSLPRRRECLLSCRHRRSRAARARLGERPARARVSFASASLRRTESSREPALLGRGELLLALLDPCQRLGQLALALLNGDDALRDASASASRARRPPRRAAGAGPHAPTRCRRVRRSDRATPSGPSGPDGTSARPRAPGALPGEPGARSRRARRSGCARARRGARPRASTSCSSMCLISSTIACCPAAGEGLPQLSAHLAQALDLRVDLRDRSHAPSNEQSAVLIPARKRLNENATITRSRAPPIRSSSKPK